MDIGRLHVAAACVSLGVGLLVLFRGDKGSYVHVALGRVFLVSMGFVNLPVLFLYEDSGRLGPFHVLAVVSVVTTTAGWLSLQPARRARRAIALHAYFMTWSWIGVTTAGLAQAANRQWPAQAPWPVFAVVAVSTLIGLAWVPRYVDRHPITQPTRRDVGQKAGPPTTSPRGHTGRCR